MDDDAGVKFLLDLFEGDLVMADSSVSSLISLDMNSGRCAVAFDRICWRGDRESDGARTFTALLLPKEVDILGLTKALVLRVKSFCRA